MRRLTEKRLDSVVRSPGYGLLGVCLNGSPNDRPGVCLNVLAE